MEIPVTRTSKDLEKIFVNFLEFRALSLVFLEKAGGS
jgi:hypothetical protein